MACQRHAEQPTKEYKVKTIAKWIGILAVLGLMLTACSSGGGGSTAVSEADLTGKWILNQSHAIGSISARDGAGKVLFSLNIDTTILYSGSAYYLDLKADHGYVANYPPNPALGIGKVSAAALMETGTWSVSGSILTTITTDGDTVKTKATVSGKAGSFLVKYYESETDEEGGFVTDIDNTFSATKE